MAFHESTPPLVRRHLRSLQVQAKSHLGALQLGAVEVARTREVERCRQHAVLTLAHPPPTEVTPTASDCGEGDWLPLP